MNPRRFALGSTLALVLAVAAAGCGPGVGGTGTGGGMTEPPAPSTSVTPASVCGADFAALLACPPAAGGGPAAQGTAPVQLADAEPQSRVTALLEGNAVTLAATCLRLDFQGDWGLSSAQGARFYGTAAQDGTRQPASLAVQAAGDQLVLTLRDTQDAVLLGPQALSRVAAPTTSAPCP